MFDAKYRPQPEAPWQEFTLHTDDLTAAMVAVQRRMFKEVDEGEWARRDAAAMARLEEGKRRREAWERRVNDER